MILTPSAFNSLIIYLEKVRCSAASESAQKEIKFLPSFFEDIDCCSAARLACGGRTEFVRPCARCCLYCSLLPLLFPFRFCDPPYVLLPCNWPASEKYVTTCFRQLELFSSTYRPRKGRICGLSAYSIPFFCLGRV